MERLSQISSHLSINIAAGGEADDVFSHLKLAPPDPILGTALAYKADKSDVKMNLGIGAYRDDNEKPYVFEVVRKVERGLVNSNINKVIIDYPYDSEQSFRNICLSKVMQNSIDSHRHLSLAKIVQMYKHLFHSFF